MRKLLGWFSIAVWATLCLSVGGAADPQSKTAPPKKTTSVKSKKKAVGKTKSGSKAAPKKGSGKAGKKASKSAKKAPPSTTWRNRQMEPTPQRYKEIQDALVAKGLLKPEDANGAWGPSSADALKRFQAGQNIESTGKIDSLSLIALGLGPKREAPAPAKPPETQPQSP